MGKQHLNQLKDRDPEKRKAAIHVLAKDLDPEALKPLARMSKNDPDEEVRTLARKAGAYILKQVRDPQPIETANGKSHTPVKIKVDEATEKRARNTVDAALTAHSNGESARALKYLSQALKDDPNLRHDGYFISIAVDVTGIGDSNEAVEKVLDANAQKTYAEQANQQKKQRKIEDHHAAIQKGSWVDVSFDFGLLAIILLVGTALLLFLSAEVARGFVGKIEANRLQVQQAQEEGRVFSPDADPVVYVSTELDVSGQPKKFTEIVPDPGLWGIANFIKERGFGNVIFPAIMICFVMSSVLLIAVWIAHLVASKVLRGDGRLPNLMHQVGSILSTRSVVLFILLGVAYMVSFEMNSSTFVLIFGGIIGLFVLLTLFKVMSVTGQAYNIGVARGMIAVLPGLVLVASALVILWMAGLTL